MLYNADIFFYLLLLKFPNVDFKVLTLLKCFQLNSWIIRMETSFKLEVTKLSVEHLQSIGDLLLQVQSI